MTDYHLTDSKPLELPCYWDFRRKRMKVIWPEAPAVEELCYYADPVRVDPATGNPDRTLHVPDRPELSVVALYEREPPTAEELRRMERKPIQLRQIAAPYWAYTSAEDAVVAALDFALGPEDGEDAFESEVSDMPPRWRITGSTIKSPGQELEDRVLHHA